MVALAEKTVAVCLLDDDPSILKATRRLLDSAGWSVEAFTDPVEFLEHAAMHCPDLAVIDIFMPEMNGIETALRLKQSGSKIKMIFLTIHEDPDFLDAALSAGAQGYVLKPYLATDLVPAVRNVLAGHTYVSPAMHASPGMHVQ